MKSNSADIPTTKQLMSLIRSSLWHTPVELRPFKDHTADWDSIGRLAMLQTVGGLAVEGAMVLPQEFKPPKDWLLKGYALVDLNRRTHTLVDSCVAETFSRLSESGLRPVLLKGQAYARAYYDPTLRQCGDIDIYVGPDNYQAAYETALKAGWESNDKFTPSAKHYRCELRGVKIELHRTAAQLSFTTADRRFRQWSLKQLTTGQHSLSIADQPVAIPTPLFDVIFVFIHMFNHFIYGGVGLRQVCDWTMLLHSHSHEIDREELTRLLKAFKIYRPWRLFTSIAVDHLGLPPEECPLYSPQFRDKAQMILSFIIHEGNFGRGVPKVSNRPSGYFRGKTHSLVRYTGRIYSKFRIDPRSIIRYHLCFMRKGIKSVVADLLKKSPVGTARGRL